MDQALGTQNDAALRAWTGKSAASWPAILAGAFVAVSASLILIVLGSGLGFAAASPWPGHGASAAGLTIGSAIWLIVTQWISAALGGYVAGRLRTKWTGTHTHEVFFRDTAHGLVTWSVATVFVAWVIAASASSALGTGMRVAAEASSAAPPGAATELAAGVGSEARPPAAMTYDVDRLFRSNGISTPAMAGTPAAASRSDARVETLSIAYHAMAAGSWSDADRGYLAALVAAQTGISASEAQHRVDEFVDATLSAATRAKENADAARKAAAEAALYTALALLMGAFIASVCGAIGGRLRDEHP